LRLNTHPDRAHTVKIESIEGINWRSDSAP